MAKANEKKPEGRFVVAMKIIAQAVLCIVILFSTANAQQENIKAGPFYSDQEDTLAVVVELPVALSPTASNFVLTVDNQEVGPAEAIKPFKLSAKKMAIVLCIDVSHSMEKRRLIEIQKALNSLVVRSRPDDRFALVSFADAPETESEFNDSRDQLTASIKELAPRGKLTRIYEAVNYALSLFDQPGLPLRRRVIIISDGKDEGSREDLDATVFKFSEKGVAIDAVARGQVEQIGEVLRLLSQGTGGQFEHSLPESLSVKDALTRIYSYLLQTRSMVAYFNYKPEPSGQLTSDARIEFMNPGEAPYPVAIATPVSLPKVKSPVVLKPLVLAGLVLAGLILTAILAFIVIKRFGNGGHQKIEPLTGHTQPPEDDSPQPPDTSHGIAPESDRTRIAGAHLPEPSKDNPAAVLAGASGSADNQVFPIEKDLFYIGANAGNDLCLTDDAYVSGKHAFLRYQQGRLIVYDCNSRNGTQVNQVGVTEAGLILDIGDRLQIGESIFVIEKAPDGSR